MPFIVTTKRPCHEVEFEVERDRTEILSRRAVATLEEARAIMRAAQNSAPEDLIVPFSVTESGGSVGPLPDGTLIEVERVFLDDLAAAAEWSGTLGSTGGTEIIAAFNAVSA